MNDSVWFHLDSYLITAHNFDDNIQDIFTEYGCFDLANELSTRLNKPIKYIYSNLEPLHAVVEIGKETYVDILGVWNESSLLKFWYEYNVELSARNKSLKYTLKYPPHMESSDEVDKQLLVTVVDKILSIGQLHVH